MEQHDWLESSGSVDGILRHRHTHRQPPEAAELDAPTYYHLFVHDDVTGRINCAFKAKKPANGAT